MWKQLLLMQILFVPKQSTLRCPAEEDRSQQFHLVRECQRDATDDALALENTSSLEECMSLARQLRGLALNYAPGRRTYIEQPKKNENRREKDVRRRLNVFQQPGEFFNCHVLQCPQNISFAGMLNDSRFDYYSLYGRPKALYNISCVPEVGLFVIYTKHSSYTNATAVCNNAVEFSGSLAHVASESRTSGLAQLLRDYNRQRSESAIFLAYVGLQFNRSTSVRPIDYRNAQQESLLCFLHRAWHVGHPRLGGSQANASCVALTPQGTWQTLSCDHELPFICEIFRSSSPSQLDTGANSADVCVVND
ncbi:hypothetical protein ACLKA6_019555 [Drosophila palustris]